MVKTDERLLAIRKVYREREEENANIFRRDMEEEFGFSYLPESIKARIHYIAYDRGHASGYSSIYAEYPDIVEFVEFIWSESGRYHSTITPAYAP